LITVDTDDESCRQCGVTYRRSEGIWRLLAAGRQEALREFIRQYEAVRIAEGRRTQDATHLRALPFRDLSRKRRAEWAMRSRSLRCLIRRVIQPLECNRAGPLTILDLGSGVGWLAYRLALRGHRVMAVDVATNDFDGLGVHRHYDRAFLSVQAEFDRLPIDGQSADVVIYNAAFHYAFDYVTALHEAMRVLAPRGRLVIMDSPIYRDPSSGVAMVREREDAFERAYGFRGNAIDTEGFLTVDRLGELGREAALRWEIFEPWYGVRWWLKPWVARLRGLREPARHKLIVGRRRDEV
jgi:SAM-dependent methyltransferase